jgi:hypothetical protein
MGIIETEAQERSNRIWPIIFIMVITGFALILFLGANHMKVRTSQTDLNPLWQNLISYLVSVGVGFLIAGAFFSAGGFIGFLFGIPKLLQNTSLSDDYIKANKPLLVQNDNLVQVSDWLTKIIVGVGLTQLSVMPTKIYNLGDSLGSSFSASLGPSDPTGRNSAIAIILYFSIIGFFATYLWTRLFFGRLLLENEAELRDNLEAAIVQTKQVQQQLKSVEEGNKLKEEDIKAVISTFSPSAHDMRQSLDGILKEADTPDDPQKGHWGGRAEVNGRRVSATVRATTLDIDLFNVIIEVISTDPLNPLNGEVIMHLHPSFPRNIITVPVQDGMAKLELVAYGAFTVGLECDAGQTLLELDLSNVPDAPPEFKER